MAAVDVLGPFEIVKRPLTLRPKGNYAVAKAKAGEPFAWWKLDERDGTAVADASGHKFAGKVMGQPAWSSSEGPLGHAFEFDGARTYIDCGDSSEFDVASNITVAAWFKVRTFDRGSQTLVSRGHESWRLQRQGSENTLSFVLTGPQTTGKDQGKSPTVISKIPVDDGQWHHAVGVYDGERVVLYLDGKEDAWVSATGPIALTTAPVIIGENGITRGRNFNGWMSDVRLYRGSLSADEVKTLFESDRKPSAK